MQIDFKTKAYRIIETFLSTFKSESHYYDLFTNIEKQIEQKLKMII